MIDELPAIQRRRRLDRPGVSTSGRVCRSLHGLPCIWHGLRCLAVPGALGAVVSTGGAYSRRPTPPGE